MPTYDGPTPRKEGNAEFSYAFAGWSPSVELVNGNATYTATFASTVNFYTITWLNYDESVLYTDNNALYGSTPTYRGPTPTKPSDGQLSYTFDQWCPQVDSVTGNATYIAMYKSSLEKTKILFDLDGGTTLSDTSPRYVDEINSDSFFFDVKKDGYNFRGWSYNGEKVFDQNGVMLSTPSLAEETVAVTLK